MYRCHDCGLLFADPTTVYDDINDEQYEECPKCTSDNFDEIPEPNDTEE